MSCHSCNELCEIDREFHDIQKNGRHEGWRASKEDTEKWIMDQLHEKTAYYYSLIEKLK